MQVDFYHLVHTPLERALPQIAEKVVASGARLLLWGGRFQLPSDSGARLRAGSHVRLARDGHHALNTLWALQVCALATSARTRTLARAHMNMRAAVTSVPAPAADICLGPDPQPTRRCAKIWQ